MNFSAFWLSVIDYYIPATVCCGPRCDRTNLTRLKVNIRHKVKIVKLPGLRGKRSGKAKLGVTLMVGQLCGRSVKARHTWLRSQNWVLHPPYVARCLCLYFSGNYIRIITLHKLINYRFYIYSIKLTFNYFFKGF